jgi:hypothetical protein
MLARWNNNEHSGTISYYPADRFFPAFVVIFNIINFIQLSRPGRDRPDINKYQHSSKLFVS